MWLRGCGYRADAFRIERLTSLMLRPSPPPLSRKRERGANTQRHHCFDALQLPFVYWLPRLRRRLG
ncbi:protein of unknown function [Cupriavidus taiwanensis]|uniref:Uncharacterized protein n=1 Tax=Cupriavidus taiwanensis TaxID=164546 RepID=A0A375IE99_9BURK|nr:hypothetical protein CBM2629_A100162 [Cupriavidus taiwanensis]SPK72400.1 protein of unknown function [Cupriavidus taiwanensis]